MLSVNFRHSDGLDLYNKLKAVVEPQYGPEVWGQLEPTIRNMQEYRSEIMNMSMFKTDNSMLEKIALYITKYLSILKKVAQSFTFGKEKGLVNCAFIWYDSISNERKASYGAVLERLSMLHNLGAIYSQIGMNMCISGDDKFKEASKTFQQAAWVFDQIKGETAALKAQEYSPDFMSETIGMCHALMLAQAQLCFYEKAKRAGLGKSLIATVSRQVSIYYGSTYKFANSPTLSKILNTKNWTNIILYNEYVYEAHAFNFMAQQHKKEVETEAKGMGPAIAYMRNAVEIIKNIAKFEKMLAASVVAQYRDFLSQYSGELADLESQNKKIYFEIVPAPDALKQISHQCFVKLIPMTEELNQPVENAEVFDSIIPASVKALDTEYKTVLNNYIMKWAQDNETHEQTSKIFLGQYHLPQCVQVLTSKEELPSDLWDKIIQAKERGGVKTIQDMIEGLQSLGLNNNNMISKIGETLKEEEDEDNGLRAKYGPQWQRMSSGTLNDSIKKQMEYYAEKSAVAAEADAKVFAKFEAARGDLAVIDMNRDQLSGMMPQSAENVDMAQNPTVIKLTGLLAQIEEGKKFRSQTLDSIMKMAEGDNILQDLVLVDQKLKDKNAVFDEHFQKYKELSGQIDQNVAERQAVFTEIEATMVDFAQIQAQMKADTPKLEFFKKIDGTLSLYNELLNNCSQGSHFYSQLCEYIHKVLQSSNDFVMSRNMEKTELLGRMGGAQEHYQKIGGGANASPYGAPSAAPMGGAPRPGAAPRPVGPGGAPFQPPIQPGGYAQPGYGQTGYGQPGAYPPQGGAYPPQGGAYPPQGYPPQGGYPPRGYPPQPQWRPK